VSSAAYYDREQVVEALLEGVLEALLFGGGVDTGQVVHLLGGGALLRRGRDGGAADPAEPVPFINDASAPRAVDGSITVRQNYLPFQITMLGILG